MHITVKILEIGKEVWTKTAKGGYGKVEVRFSGDKGEQKRNFVSYDNIYAEVKKLVVGNTYEVRIEKEGDFWNWKEINEVSGGGEDKPTSTKGTSTGSNWDERLKFDKEKQIYIVRQSQLTNAVAILGPGQMIQDYCRLADDLSAYVMTGKLPPFDGEGAIDDGPQEEAPRRPGRPRKEVAEAE